MSQLEKLQRELHLKQLQINSLQAITQAINNNVASEGLFNMYEGFLQFEMGIKKTALFFREGDEWECKASVGISEQMLENNYGAALSEFTTNTALTESTHPFFSLFDLVIPVRHKRVPLAYAFVGGFNENDDVYNKVQFITTITNIIAVAIENKRLFKEQVRQQIFDREIELAAEIQQTLVPSRLPFGKSYELSSIYKPHSVVGGDYYDVVEFPGEKLTFCIADITGKGVAAALLMANFQASLHALVHRCDTLEEIVDEMNRAVFRVTRGEKFITLFLAKYNSITRTLHYINAGHPSAFLVMNNEIFHLTNGTTILGFLPELPAIEIGGVCLTDEALIFTYTDGLTDILNAEGEEFGESRLCDFLLANAQLPAKQLNVQLLNLVKNHSNGIAYPDDITVLTCKVFK